MDALILTALFFFFLLTSIPIAIAIGLAVISYTVIFPVGGLSFIAQNMYSSLNSLPLLALPFFMLAGNIMEVGGLSRRLINVANCLVGNATSGLAIVTILACMFFGAISGSAPATVAAIGGIMIPAMVKYKYSKDFAAGLIASAGGLGIIIPPSIPLVIFGICTQTSVGDLFLGGIIPGCIVGIALMIAARYVGKKRGYKGTGQPFELKFFLSTVWEAKWALFVPVLILGGIYGGAFTPTEAAVVAVLYGMFVSMAIYRELTFAQLLDIFADTGSLVGTVFLLFGTATSLAFLVSIADVPTRISDAIMAISANKYVVLVLINIFLLIAGMIMDTMSANLIFSSLLMAIVKPLGVDPVHFGIIVTINLALGFVTPPMAANAFLTSTLTGVPVSAIFRESTPFIIAMLFALALITFIPELTLLPLMLLR